jgi:beta-1,4-N-acetylglucosaminyltransferase
VLMGKTAFVTVGSTQFDALVDTVLGSEVIRVLQEHKFTRLVVQAGKSPIHVESTTASISNGGIETWRVNIRGLDTEIWRFKPSLELDFRSADLVICHAGVSLLEMIMHCT